MMNKKLTLIIVLQAILIIALFWALVFYGKDEYEAYQAEQEEEIESPSRVTEKQGINIVSLPPATQQNSGIRTARVTAASYQGEIKSFGNVIGIDSLIEAKASYLTLKTNANLARAASSQNMQQYQRLKTLNEDDKNVSDRAVQEALAAVNADKANITASELQLKNLQNRMRLQWGEALAKLAFNEKLPPHLENLLNRKNVLIQASLPLSNATPKAGSSIAVTPLNESSSPIKAIYVSPASTSDSNGFGKTFYYSAPADQLRIGMRVNVEAAASDSTNGIIIPSSAVVWYAGTPWAYFKQGNDQFVRNPISADTEVEAGWFNQGLDANSEVVVNGAQLLLSEEFKYLIKNENED
jgi:multidrug efflux pump subunit AcrA (membrane-fusion protein)